MATPTDLLAPPLRSQARELWRALYGANSGEAVLEARRQFDEAPQEVREAILFESVQAWHGEEEVELNPFE